MVSQISNDIDFDKLEQEARASIDADAKYWRENDAKFRAVDQKVASYEEFRDIVLASHLKPLEKKDKIGSNFSHIWNSNATDQNLERNISSNSTIIMQNSTSSIVTSDELLKWWKRHPTTDDRYNMLTSLNPQHRQQLFGNDVIGGLLAELIVSIQEHLCSNDIEAVIDVLSIVSLTKRFQLSLQFCSASEREKCQLLFGRLLDETSSTVNHEKVLDLAKRYSCIK